MGFLNLEQMNISLKRKFLIDQKQGSIGLLDRIAKNVMVKKGQRKKG